MQKSILTFSFLLAFSVLNGQNNEVDDSYDELMYMSSVYPVEIVDEKISLDSLNADSHSETINSGINNKAKQPINMIYAVADHKGLIYVESEKDQYVKAVHVINPNGHEILCFPKIVPHHNLLKLDLGSLAPGRYMLILEGAFVSTRDISINDQYLVAQLR